MLTMLKKNIYCAPRSAYFVVTNYCIIIDPYEKNTNKKSTHRSLWKKYIVFQLPLTYTTRLLTFDIMGQSI